MMYRGDGTQGGFAIKKYYGGDHYGYKETMHTSSSQGRSQDLEKGG